MSAPRLFVLDAMGLAYRAYYAFIGRPLVNSKGENTSAIFGFANTVLKIRREENPDHWALAWDGPGATWRHERFPDYKAQRKPMPDDLLAQLEPIEVLAQALGLPVLEIPGMEADDVMCTLAHRGARDGFEVVLVTGDKDMLQVVGGPVKVLVPQTREAYEWVDADAVRAKWEVGPEHIRDVLALMGDSTDNIPGVPGIGEKTAKELMRQFGSLDAVYERLDEVRKPSVRAKLEANRERAFLSRELATARCDLDLPFSWDELRCAPIRRDLLLDFARRWEIRRLEQIAQSLGVGEDEAGALSPGRAPSRRGTASETPAPGVKLSQPARKAAPPDPPAPVSPEPPAPGPPEGSAPEPPESSARAEPPAPGPPESSAPPEPPAGSGPPAARAEAPPAPAAWGEPPELPGSLELPEPPRSATALAAPAPAPPAGAQSTLDLWDSPEIVAAGGEANLLEAWTQELHEVRARALHGLALLPLASGPDPRTARLVGLALAARDGTTCYVPLAHDSGPNLPPARVREWLAPAMADPTVPKIGHDLKADAHVLAGAGLRLEGFAFDAHLGSFLCDPERDHRLPALARDFLGVELPPLEPAAARGRPRPSAAALPPATARAAATRGAAALLALEGALRAQLESREQWSLYAGIEQPLIPVLLEMERAGIALDRAVLAEMSGRAAEDIARLEEALTVLADEKINLNSGPQIARVLFEKLKLRTGRRTKTGFSTDQAVLEELAAGHAFPRLLLEYRALTKLKSTYLDALPAATDLADGRVHTTFRQAAAATGRLASSDPNLQNIPFRTPQGRAIRRAFVAPPGQLLVGADFSQIELRVMAHLSGDPALIEAFHAGEDVHASTARRIFDVQGPLDPALRARAKVVNFGIMYGMGARSLAQQMGLELAEAEEFIRHYFAVYARVREYLDATLDEARRLGWVRTLFGRRRYLPDLHSVHGGQRALAERAAINMPIQGTAADLVKKAMIRVDAALRAQVPSARLLLQVHDELLLQCPAAEAEAAAAITRAEMRDCARLKVPLEVSVGVGPTWFDVH